MSTGTSQEAVGTRQSVRDDVMLHAIFLNLVLVSQDCITRQATSYYYTVCKNELFLDLEALSTSIESCANSLGPKLQDNARCGPRVSEYGLSTIPDGRVKLRASVVATEGNYGTATAQRSCYHVEQSRSIVKARRQKLWAVRYNRGAL